MNPPTSSTRRVWTLGEAMAALVAPGIGPAEHANELRVGSGGAELNVAIGLARLGHPVTWIGVVGNDPWGRRIIRDLRAEGVETRARICGDAFTGAYLRERRAMGMIRASYLRRGSAGSCLDVEDLDALTLEAGDILHLTGLTPVLSDTARAAWTAAAWRARSAGVLVSLDINYRSAVATPLDVRTAFEAISGAVDLVFASPEEAGIVCGREDDKSLGVQGHAESLARLLPEGSTVVIKDGADGSLHRAGDGTWTRGAALAVQVIDLVGAGDSFAAGYLSALLDAEPPAARLARAHACAAFVVATDGDWEGAPRRNELTASHTFDGQQVHR